MKLFPIKFMSNYDKMKNLVDIMGTVSKVNNTTRNQIISKTPKDTFHKSVLGVKTKLTVNKNGELELNTDTKQIANRMYLRDLVQKYIKR